MSTVQLSLLQPCLNDQTSFMESLKKLSTENSLSVDSQGTLIPTGWFNNLFKGVSISTNSRLIELKIMEFLIHGKQWLKLEDMALVKQLASKAGLFVEKRESASDHKELSVLIDWIAKEILKKESIPTKKYEDLCKAFQIQHRNALKPFTKQCEQVMKNFAELYPLQNETKEHEIKESMGDETPSKDNREEAEEQSPNEIQKPDLSKEMIYFEKDSAADALAEKKRLDAVANFTIPESNRKAPSSPRRRKAVNSKNKYFVAKVASGVLGSAAIIGTVYSVYKRLTPAANVIPNNDIQVKTTNIPPTNIIPVKPVNISIPQVDSSISYGIIGLLSLSLFAVICVSAFCCFKKGCNQPKNNDDPLPKKSFKKTENDLEIRSRKEITSDKSTERRSRSTPPSHKGFNLEPKNELKELPQGPKDQPESLGNHSEEEDENQLEELLIKDETILINVDPSEDNTNPINGPKATENTSKPIIKIEDESNEDNLAPTSKQKQQNIGQLSPFSHLQQSDRQVEMTPQNLSPLGQLKWHEMNQTTSDNLKSQEFQNPNNGATQENEEGVKTNVSSTSEKISSDNGQKRQINKLESESPYKGKRIEAWASLDELCNDFYRYEEFINIKTDPDAIDLLKTFNVIVLNIMKDYLEKMIDQEKNCTDSDYELIISSLISHNSPNKEESFLDELKRVFLDTESEWLYVFEKFTLEKFYPLLKQAIIDFKKRKQINFDQDIDSFSDTESDQESVGKEPKTKSLKS